MKTLIFLPILSALLAGCGSEQPEPAPAPTTYAILKGDIYRNTPMDFCRRNDRDFLAKLMARVDRALPPARSATEQFEDFNVVPQMHGGPGKEAVIRFRVADPGADPILIAGIGTFEERGCKIGPMSFHIGPVPIGPVAFAEKAS